jgi:hypothetical protein
MLEYLLAFTIILIVMLGWVLAKQIARRFAQRHPQFGALKEEGSGRCHGCLCTDNKCKQQHTELTISGDEHDSLK